jgi:hypothetical protein
VELGLRRAPGSGAACDGEGGDGGGVDVAVGDRCSAPIGAGLRRLVWHPCDGQRRRVTLGPRRKKALEGWVRPHGLASGG